MVVKNKFFQYRPLDIIYNGVHGGLFNNLYFSLSPRTFRLNHYVDLYYKRSKGLNYWVDNTETKISDISEDYLNAYKLLLLYKIKDLKQPNAEDIKNLALYYKKLQAKYPDNPSISGE